MAEQFTDIESFLEANKEAFLFKWKEKVETDLSANTTPETNHPLDEEEFTNLFQVYMGFMLHDDEDRTSTFVAGLIQKKIKEGFLLSTLELINASFMQTARELFREAYPDAFDTRMEYLERLSQMILNNEVTMAHYYENYLKDLNNKLQEHAGRLEQHNTSLVEFIDIATHQLQAPLWSILGFVSKLQRKFYEVLDEEGRHCLNRITANVSDMHQLIADVTEMLMITKDDRINKELYLGDLISLSIGRIHNELDKHFKCHIESEEPVVMTGDPNHLKELFYQLLKNASQYTFPGKPGVAFISWKKEDGGFHLFIEDEGIGIEERFTELVFKPMERLKELDIPGSGMGLTFALRIVKGHGGSIRIMRSENHKGTCIHMEFPLDIVRSI